MVNQNNSYYIELKPKAGQDDDKLRIVGTGFIIDKPMEAKSADNSAWRSIDFTYSKTATFLTGYGTLCILSNRGRPERPSSFRAGDIILQTGIILTFEPPPNPPPLGEGA